MKLSSLNTARMPGPGDMGEPPDLDGFDMFSEADALLGAATTEDGARLFANELTFEQLRSLVLACAVLALQDDHGDKAAIASRLLSLRMRNVALMVADRMHREGRL